jgi:3-oxoacyl-[acyl-carrier-protein] synthase II
VTGLGLVTPLGTGVEATWAALVGGERAIRPIRLFSAAGQRSELAAEVEGVEVPGAGWSRTSAMAATAAAEAMQESQLDPRTLRVGLVIGSTTGGMFETEERIARLHGEPGSNAALADLLSHPLTAIGDRLAERLGPFVRVRMLSSACSSGANALIVAAAWLRSGEVDAVVAGGTDALCRLTLTGFNALGALDPQPCKPFDRERHGTNLGEGAGFLVLERAGTAGRREARPIAELAGWAMGAEAHHITNPAPDGALVASLLSRALARGGLTAADVDYINAHGTGTPVNDSMEAAALARGLGAEVGRVPISSSKGQLGHSLGAAGAVEAVVTALVVERATLPPTAGLTDPDPGTPLLHLRAARRVPKVRAALSCSFGFGGLDTVLALRSPDRAARADDLSEGDCVIAGVAVVGVCGVLSGVACASVVSLPPWTEETPPGSVDLDSRLEPARARRLDPIARLGVVAAEQALRDAGGKDAATGIILGSAFGNVDASAAFMHRIFDKGPRAASPAEFPNLVPSSPAGHASIYLGLQGPAFATADLGTSGESAFAQAVQLVGSGEAPRMVAGVGHARSGIVERVLSELFAPSTSHRARGLSDVAAAIVVEDAARAARRGGKVLARVVQVIEWRTDVDRALAQLQRPGPGQCEVALSRTSDAATALLARSPWDACARTSCDAALGDSDGLGAVAIAVAAARIAAGLVSEVLVVGLDESRGYFVLLSAP